MTDKTTEALKLAEEALETAPIEYDFHGEPVDKEFAVLSNKALAAIREALAEQEKQEPVAEVVFRNQTVGFGRTEERKDIVFLADVEVGTKLYAAPVRTKDLTDTEIATLVQRHTIDGKIMPFALCEAAIAADREKNK